MHLFGVTPSLTHFKKISSMVSRMYYFNKKYYIFLDTIRNSAWYFQICWTTNGEIVKNFLVYSGSFGYYLVPTSADKKLNRIKKKNSTVNRLTYIDLLKLILLTRVSFHYPNVSFKIRINENIYTKKDPSVHRPDFQSFDKQIINAFIHETTVSGINIKKQLYM